MQLYFRMILCYLWSFIDLLCLNCIIICISHGKWTWTATHGLWLMADWNNWEVTSDVCFIKQSKGYRLQTVTVWFKFCKGIWLCEAVAPITNCMCAKCFGWVPVGISHGCQNYQQISYWACVKLNNLNHPNKPTNAYSLYKIIKRPCMLTDQHI